ncbi:MAG: NAD(P)-binding domain-containing protein [Deinococcales bacterium]
MERLALLGLSYKRGGVGVLEQAARLSAHLSPVALAPYVQEFVLIQTCNRFDLVCALQDGQEVEKLRNYLSQLIGKKPYLYLADAALEQLCRIAASLDSLNPGEDQIMNQVREAYSRAKAEGTLGGMTAFAFEQAMQIAKKVRRDIEIAPMDTSLFSLAKPSLEKTLAKGDKVAIIGAGEMGALAAKSLADLGRYELILVNRDKTRAENLKQQLPQTSLLSVMSLAEFFQQKPAVQALVTATPVQNLIGLSFSQHLPLKILVDLGIPRNVGPEVAKYLPVLDVETLQEAGRARRKELAHKLARADQLIQQELLISQQTWTEKQLGPAIKRLREHYAEVLSDLSPQDAIEFWDACCMFPLKV